MIQSVLKYPMRQRQNALLASKRCFEDSNNKEGQ